MYIRTLENPGLGLGQPPLAPKSQQPALQKKFTSSVLTYKDGRGQCRSTDCSIYVPGTIRNQPKLDILVFFHGILDVCDSAHNFDPDNVVKKFQLDIQVDSPPQLALAAPIVFWNTADRRSGIIRAAWSAAYLNAFIEEVLDQIGQPPAARPNLGRLNLAGHSAAYDILTPLADQFDCGVAETKKGALAKLDRVLAMDTTYRTQDAKSLEQWARKLEAVQFILVFSKRDPSRTVWKDWEKTRKKMTGQAERPKNLKVFNMTADGHCDLPRRYVSAFL